MNRRIAGFAGDDDLRGSGEHVDGAIKGDELLGGGDPGVAGTDDLVDAGQCSRFHRPARRWHALRPRGKTR